MRSLPRPLETLPPVEVLLTFPLMIRNCGLKMLPSRILIWIELPSAAPPVGITMEKAAAVGLATSHPTPIHNAAPPTGTVRLRADCWRGALWAPDFLRRRRLAPSLSGSIRIPFHGTGVTAWG